MKWSIKQFFLDFPFSRSSLVTEVANSKFPMPLPHISLLVCIFSYFLCSQHSLHHDKINNLFFEFLNIFLAHSFGDFGPWVYDSVTFRPVMRQNIMTETPDRGSVFVSSKKRKRERESRKGGEGGKVSLKIHARAPQWPDFYQVFLQWFHFLRLYYVLWGTFQTQTKERASAASSLR